jgi:hypothetical protein
MTDVSVSFSVARTLLCAVRYAHMRSLHPYEDVVHAVNHLWPMLNVQDRRWFLDILRTQTIPDLTHWCEQTSEQTFSPVTRREIEEERDAYARLIARLEASDPPNE